MSYLSCVPGVLLVAAACTAAPAGSRAPLGRPAPTSLVVLRQDSIHARANLEFADDSDDSVERWPQASLDSIAEALASLRDVDSLTRGQLSADEFWTDRWSSLVVMISPRAREPEDAVSACLRTFHGDTMPRSRIPCWPALDSLLIQVVGAQIFDIRVEDPFQRAFRLMVPLPYNRMRLRTRVKEAGVAAGLPVERVIVFPEPAFNLHEYERVDRSVRPWKYVIVRGDGDCPSGCIHNRFYEYRYDPRTRRAWKEREYSDPDPEPDDEPFVPLNK